MRTRGSNDKHYVPHHVTQRPKGRPTLRIKPVKQTCAVSGCSDVARFVVAVTTSGDGGIRAARRCCGEHLEETVFWAEGIVEADPRVRYAVINRWGPWALNLHEVPA